MMYILLYSHNPLHHALVGAIGALITYLMYLGISFLIAFIRGRKTKNEDVREMNPNEEISYMKGINLMSVKAGKWGKRFIYFVISAGIILGLFGLGGWIYNDFYLPSHYESLYEEGMKDVNKADEIALELFQAEYETKAIEVLTYSAEKGNVKSMVLLGRYYKGYRFKPCSEVELWDSKNFHIDWENIDREKSAYWFLQAAKRNDAESQGELGDCYKYGFGVKQDFDKAIYWTKQGANNGDAVAQWRMGNLYESGLAYYRGYFKDYQIWWYNGNGFTAKDNPNVEMNRQYVAEMKSREPEQVFLIHNIKKAKYYWKLAANQGFQKAKSSLEKIYEGDD